MSCDCKCFVALPHGAMSWCVIVVFLDLTHLLFELPAAFSIAQSIANEDSNYSLEAKPYLSSV